MQWLIDFLLSPWPWRLWTWLYWSAPFILLIGGLLVVAVEGGLFAAIGAIGMCVGVFEFSHRWRR